MLTDEMLMRASTEEQLGLADALHKPFDQVARGGRILLVEDNDGSIGAFWRRSGASSSSPGRPIQPVRCCDFPTATSTSSS
jgi:hypothetical protein